MLISPYNALFLWSDIFPQTYEYYDLVMRSIDAVLALATEEQTAKAAAISDKVELPAFLFKKFDKEFYRAGTP